MELPNSARKVGLIAVALSMVAMTFAAGWFAGSRQFAPAGNRFSLHVQGMSVFRIDRFTGEVHVIGVTDGKVRDILLMRAPGLSDRAQSAEAFLEQKP